MSRRRLAFAPVPSSPAAHTKGSRDSGKKSAGRRGRQPRRESSARAQQPVWTELEEAFFAAARPDEPAAPVQPEAFDDLDGPPSQGGRGRLTAGALWSALRRLFVRPPNPAPHRG